MTRPAIPGKGRNMADKDKNESKTPFADFFFSGLERLSETGQNLTEKGKTILDMQTALKALQVESPKDIKKLLFWTDKEAGILDLQTVWIKKLLLNHFLHLKHYRDQKAAMLAEMQELNRQEAAGLQVMKSQPTPPLIEGGAAEMRRILQENEPHPFLTTPHGEHIKYCAKINKAFKAIKAMPENERKAARIKAIKQILKEYDFLTFYLFDVEYCEQTKKETKGKSRGQIAAEMVLNRRFLNADVFSDFDYCIKQISAAEIERHGIKYLNNRRRFFEKEVLAKEDYTQCRAALIDIVETYKKCGLLKSEAKMKAAAQSEFIQDRIKRDFFKYFYEGSESTAKALFSFFDVPITDLKETFFYTFDDILKPNETPESPAQSTASQQTARPKQTENPGFIMPKTPDFAEWQPQLIRKQAAAAYITSQAAPLAEPKEAESPETQERRDTESTDTGRPAGTENAALIPATAKPKINYTVANAPLHIPSRPHSISPLERSDLFNAIPRDKAETPAAKRAREKAEQQGQLFLDFVHTGKDKDGNEAGISVFYQGQRVYLSPAERRILDVINQICLFNYSRLFSFEKLLEALNIKNPRPKERQEIKKTIEKLASLRLKIMANKSDVNLFGMGKLTEFTGALISVYTFVIDNETYYSIREMPPLFAFAYERKQIRNYTNAAWNIPQRGALMQALHTFFLVELPLKKHNAEQGRAYNDRITFAYIRQEMYLKLGTYPRLDRIKSYSKKILDRLTNEGIFTEYQILKEFIFFKFEPPKT